MAEFLGNGVTRTLSALQRQFQTVVFQDKKPPLDSELNLAQVVASESFQTFVRSQVPSGFFLDPTRPLDDFVVDPLNSNQLRLGQQKNTEDGAVEEQQSGLWANVHGMIVPVFGTRNTTETATDNVVQLNPPPSSGSRIDFVFLEVWKALASSNPATDNKPSASTFWTYGNVEYGATNVDDNSVDPLIGSETTKRVQIQYRLRVVGSGTGAGVSPDLAVYPDGLTDPNIRAQGPLSAPSAEAYATFSNMRNELGDASLWRAGDGNPQTGFATVDGYIYAVPMLAVFRRNSSSYVAVNTAGDPNQNGSFERTPSTSGLTDPRAGATLLTQMSLVNTLTATQNALDVTVEVDNLVGSGLDDSGHTFANVFLRIDDEVVAVSAVDTASSPNTLTIPANGRGQWGTDVVRHEGRSNVAVVGSGTAISFFNTRPDGRYADQIAKEDLCDLRRGVSMGGWDYSQLLLHNVSALMRNNLRSTWKTSGVTGNSQGVSLEEVSYLDQDGGTAAPNATEALDGPDGVRYMWSDGAVLQPRVTSLLDNDGAMAAGFIQNLDDTVTWDAGADLKPAGFLNNRNNTTPGFTNGSALFVHLGGDSGNEGTRKTFRDGATRAVRFLGPKEYWKGSDLNRAENGNQHPVTLSWLNTTQANTGVQASGAGLQAFAPAGPGETATAHPGPMYPLQSLGFEKPFIVLGGLVNTAFQVAGIDPTLHLADNNSNPAIPLGEGEIVLSGLDFDTAGDWYSLNTAGAIADDPTVLTNPVMRGQRTLYDLLTAGGRDMTGSSSELYLVMYGDDQTEVNNGAFQVIGAGTVGYTTSSASAANTIRVRFLSQGVTAFDLTSTGTLTAEGRSMEHNAEDGNGATSGPAAMAIVLTDITAQEGGASNPWNQANINSASLPGRTLEAPFNFKALLNTTLFYHGGRGATARVADRIHSVKMMNPPANILQQSPSVLDTDFAAASGAASAEVEFTQAHIQLWNRLPSKGLDAPHAPAYGGNVVLNSEVTRETEALMDRGSKTLMFRPFQRLSMTMQAMTTANTGTNPSLMGPTSYPNPALIPSGYNGPKDDGQIHTAGLQMGYQVPPQWMPRFGRQDIPYYQDNGPAYGGGSFLEGINHLFTDSTDSSNPAFYIIGGPDNQSGGALVSRMLVQTGATGGLGYGEYGNILGPTTPAYQGRLTTEIGTGCVEAEEITNKLANTTSSDFGKGLRGIQMPPYLGLARVYGVYDRREFVASGGVTYGADRVTPQAGAATNLLRRDAKRQTLFICKDGAYDLTGERGDHTYIIPENVLDITKSSSYVEGETFTDLEYVVECTMFGFSRGFIDGNNYVLARRHNGAGALISDGDNPELEGVAMCLPHAAPDSSTVYLGYERTVYQGDPYMTRAGNTRTTSDYEPRLGQVAASDAVQLQTPIQQFDDSGAQIPQRLNARGLEVLSSLDFYTTMGSGGIGGPVFAGTETDVGYLENTNAAASRVPESRSQPAWRFLPRAFTEGQKKNTSRAYLDLRVNGNNLTINFGSTAVRIVKLDGTVVSFTAFNGPTANADLFDAGSPGEVTAARELAVKMAAREDLQDTIFVRHDEDGQVIRIYARSVGAEGNGIQVQITDTENMSLLLPRSGEEGLDSVITSANLSGGVDLNVNAGDGTSKFDLTGMTERLPMGILSQDSDFLGENPLNDSSSAVQTLLGGLRPSQRLLPLTQNGGEEYTPHSGAPGELIGMGDGGVLQYQAYTSASPGGSQSYRIYRGGGSVFVLGGTNPGGPVDWNSGSLEPSVQPVLKGALLAGKALLVRNFQEEAFAADTEVSSGDEVQMVVLTTAVHGGESVTARGVDLSGIISPTGYGEGKTAADRYRLSGKPMVKGRTRVIPDPATTPLAPFAQEE